MRRIRLTVLEPAALAVELQPDRRAREADLANRLERRARLHAVGIVPAQEYAPGHRRGLAAERHSRRIAEPAPCAIEMAADLCRLERDLALRREAMAKFVVHDLAQTGLSLDGCACAVQRFAGSPRVRILALHRRERSAIAIQLADFRADKRNASDRFEWSPWFIVGWPEKHKAGNAGAIKHDGLAFRIGKRAARAVQVSAD